MREFKKKIYFFAKWGIVAAPLLIMTSVVMNEFKELDLSKYGFTRVKPKSNDFKGDKFKLLDEEMSKVNDPNNFSDLGGVPVGQPKNDPPENKNSIFYGLDGIPVNDPLEASSIEVFKRYTSIYLDKISIFLKYAFIFLYVLTGCCMLHDLLFNFGNIIEWIKGKFGIQKND